MTSDATVKLAQDIYHRLTSAELPSRVEFVEFKPEWEGSFGNAATRLRCKNQSNASVIEALEWLEQSGTVYLSRVPSDAEAPPAPEGQERPERFDCVVELR